MRKRNIFYISFFLGFIFLVFRNWFLTPEIIGGDWPYFFPEMLRDPSLYFSSWNPGAGNGLGGVNPLYSLSVFMGFTVFLTHAFSIPWVFIYKFFWFLLPLLFGILSSIYLVKTIFPKSSLWQQLFSSFIFTTNTYFLMVVGGGQMGVALAYSIAPLVLGSFIKIINLISSSEFNSKFKIQNSKFSVLAGLVLAIQVMFDPRIAYLTMIATGVYIFFSTAFIEFSAKKIFSFFLSLMFFGLGLPVLITGLLHSVWIFPILFLQNNPIPQDLTNIDGFRFFSFADFSHTFSLLHPNWPENIFGKVGFMKPEFIIIPILAYSSLLFLNKNNLAIQQFNPEKIASQFNGAGNRTILFFALLGIVGAFLAKGANPPFGEINASLFEHIPGMNMFRDPTKFYLLIALSYSILIPFSISKLTEKVSNIKYKVLIFATFLVVWAILIHPAILGQLGGTFKEREVPLEYVKLKDFLYRQPGFFRTLWIPRQHRFTYNFWSRMPVEAEPLLKRTKINDIISDLRKPEIREYLSELGIKYVIVPYDLYGEIFVKDRKYDAIAYQQAVRKLETIPWLKKIDGFGKIAVFETKIAPKDLFWLEEKGTITYVPGNPTRYSVNFNIDSPQKLIFSESYNPYWVLKKSQEIIFSKKTKNGLNSFWLDQKGKYMVDISFFLEKYYEYGRIVSFMILLLVLFLIF